MRLALYAHYSCSGGVARYVLYYLRQLRELGFRVCFISNSQIPPSKQPELREICEKVIERENTGFDFAMWQRALAEYEVAQFDELLLTNSSIVGPLLPLEPLWQRPANSQCDFWGLTDNDELGHHLQSYFMVFRRQVLQHPCFRDFWDSVLPFRDKEVVIGSYEIGLTRWLEEHGLRWSALFPQKDIQALLISRRKLSEKLKNRFSPLALPQNTTMLLPGLLLECGMPFLKVGLLSGAGGEMQVSQEVALRLLETSGIPVDVLEELRMGLVE